jgi:glucuronokinase
VTPIKRAHGAALARAALAGNPSDGYGGAVLAVTLPTWSARAEARRAGELAIEPANALVEATVGRFSRELEPAGLASAVSWSTSIPQRVGLGSSSALVIAVLRALCALYGVELAPADLAELALAVETEELGIVAGLQDRVAQAYEGLMFMEFGAARNGLGRDYARLDPTLLPHLVIAWRPEAAGHSGDVHTGLRERHEQGESAVREAMFALAAAARGARAALVGRDLARFAQCVDQTFDVRARLMALDGLCVEMIEVARSCGASANYTGSGGAIVAVCRDQSHVAELSAALGTVGCGVAPVPLVGAARAV